MAAESPALTCTFLPVHAACQIRPNSRLRYTACRQGTAHLRPKELTAQYQLADPMNGNAKSAARSESAHEDDPALQYYSNHGILADT